MISAFAEEDFLARYLFPPELILQYQKEISLTDEQRELVITAVRRLEKEAAAARAELEAEQKKLEALLKAEKVDEKAALEQLEKIHARNAKQTIDHLRQVLKMKNALTGAQQARLQELKKNGKAQYPPPSLQQKLEELQARAEEAAAAGRDPSPAAQLMQDFEGLIASGKLAEAEALVARALKALEP